MDDDGHFDAGLAQRGVPVHGIDMSRAMLAKLAAKPGADAVAVTVGDIATVVVGEPFTAMSRSHVSVWERSA